MSRHTSHITCLLDSLYNNIMEAKSCGINRSPYKCGSGGQLLKLDNSARQACSRAWGLLSVRPFPSRRWTTRSTPLPSPWPWAATGPA